jgi:hypothetical protein
MTTSPAVPGHCPCCLHTLGFGPRLKRIVLYLVRHADEWEHDASLAALRFGFPPGSDQARVTYRVEQRDRFEEVA